MPSPLDAPEAALKTAKGRAHFWLAAAFCAFIAALFLPNSWWQGALKAAAEAALVGGLADWFAVSALFRRIPIPLLAGHSNILPRNQARIASNLGAFVREHFFGSTALAKVLAQHDMAAVAAQWLAADDKRLALSQHMQQALRGALQALDEAPIQRLLLAGLQRAFTQLDMRPALAQLMRSMSTQSRQQQLIDEAVSALAAYLARPETHGQFVSAMSAWVEREYPKLQKVLPTELLGKKGADLLRKLLHDFFADIQRDPQHFLRLEIHASVQGLQDQLQHDPVWQARVQQFAQQLAEHEELQHFVRGIAGDLRAWLLDDLHAPDSRIRAQLDGAGLWLANTLQSDQTLRRSLNHQLQSAVLALAPDIGRFVQEHISSILQNWDSREMVAQIEQQVGPDLQKIRINGTILGGFIGLVLFAIAQLAAQI